MTKQEKINRIIELLTEAALIIADLGQEKEPSLLDVAISQIGKDASPQDLAPDELGCAESVSVLIGQSYGNFPVITGTWTLYQRLENDPRFSSVLTPQAGDIIISPTGSLANAPFPGHTGIMLDDHHIMSNDSSSGTWQDNYTLTTWNKRWGKAGYPTYFYRYNG